ncbi:molybdopterin-guanine dinucleotide biosynthesis protein B [Hylemonella gracilis]|uniref:Molybdopterin-guanine dinucleotide biosynthesis protein B n=1 Tax=Hylemonella gracilis TaxID=80880 RepID=A0A4P6UPX1_9BURK|nr:molybdopterin-guanine dinucleotide biosynthesis protein B [Hylemonella gracilis]QBK05741.1 molybdopterin-guanine dinucleotide biosynthesis protein B [Hylemonella gracilis]
MNVVGFAGYSGAGKTTLVEQLIPAFKAHGLRVSVIKHAHHRFDVDHPGKDSWRHRQAGAFEVLVASDRRLALLREYEREHEPQVHHLLAELSPVVDWVLVEGFRHSDLPKIEVWRADAAQPVCYPDDPYVVAIATDEASRLPVPTGLDRLNLNAPEAVRDWLLSQGNRFEYLAETYLG